MPEAVCGLAGRLPKPDIRDVFPTSHTRLEQQVAAYHPDPRGIARLY
jgi:hypothetical protein